MDLQTLFWNASVHDIAKGFNYNKQNKTYICLICGESFEKDRVYPINENFYTAKKMVEHHIKTAHDGMFNHIISLNKSYTSLSDNQKSVLSGIYKGDTDIEIAKDLGISASTIRNYKFKFREKEKQAKIFLAMMTSLNNELDSSKEQPLDQIITPHKGATCIDERYDITEKDKLQTLEHYFDTHGKMLNFPSKQKKKIIVLTEIAKNFKAKKIYPEKEINRILKRIYEIDYVLVRRYLIQYGFLDRNNEGSEYWVK